METANKSYRLDDFSSGPIGNFLGELDRLESAEQEIPAEFSDKRSSEYEGQHLAHYQITEFTGEWGEANILRCFYYYE